MKNRKVAKTPKSSPTTKNVLYLIMLHIDVNIDKKLQPSIFYRSQENHVSLKTYGQTDISNYRVALLLKKRTINNLFVTKEILQIRC